MSAMKGHHGISSMLCAYEGTEIQSRDNKGNTPLHFAAAGGYTDIIGLLLSKGADINCVNNDGKTPMHLAVEKNKMEVVDFILDIHEYKYDIKDKDEMIAFDKASPEVHELFVEAYPELKGKEKVKCRI